MKRLSIAIALFTVLLFALAWKSGEAGRLSLAVVGVLLAIATWRSVGRSHFLNIFIAIFGTEFIVFGTMLALSAEGFWPETLKDVLPPDSLPMTVGIFGVIVHAISHIKGIGTMTRIADRYFETDSRITLKPWGMSAFSVREQGLARLLVVTLVLINQAQVGISVRLSFFNRDWFNAMQDKDSEKFWSLLYTVFLFWAVIFIVSAVIEYVLQSRLIINWRRWLTARYIGDWLDQGSHYRMALVGNPADNPDQRIADDVDMFISRTYNFSISLLSSTSSLVSFSIILWTISENFTIPGTEISVPGFLFWVALLYSGVGTLITHLIGRRLIGLYFNQQKYEANFRFSLARLREYAEQVALLKGEPTERGLLMGRFHDVIRNFLAIVAVRKVLMTFTAFYGQVSPFIPYIVAAPFYFLGKIQLGVLTQTANAFGRVEGSLSYFIDAYASVADYISVVKRLQSFDQSVDAARAQGHDHIGIERRLGTGQDVHVEGLTLALPHGENIASVSLVLHPREHVLITGPSGSGKSTLMRALSGVWPYGQGVITLPEHCDVMLLPQKPYLPQGTLRDAITYPAADGTYPDDEMIAVLKSVGLERMGHALDDDENWAQRLSGGEQQRLSIARALLAKPDLLFLDEATSAMDEDGEAKIYAALKSHLPNATLVSIGHRSTLRAMHDRVIMMQPRAEGGFSLNG